MSTGREPNLRAQSEMGHDPQEKWGPLSASESDLALMAKDWDRLVEKAKLVRHWLDLDCRPTEEFDDLMKALAIYDRVMQKPTGEMAVIGD